MSRYFIFCIALFSTPAFSFDAPGLFGFEIGKQVQMEDCISNNNGSYPVYANAPCVVRSAAMKFDDGREEFEVYLPDNKPDYLLTMHVTLLNGFVEKISTGTHGRRYQEDILFALSKKFGKPKKIDRPIMQNGFGAKLQQLNAVWDVAGSKVRLVGMEGSSDSGAIYVESAKWLRYLSGAEREKTNKSMKM